MSIGLTYTEEKKSDSSAKHANNERGHSMPGRIAGQSSKLSTLLVGVEASVPTAAGELDMRQVACDSRKVRPRALFFALHGAKADGNALFAMRCPAGRSPLPAKTRRGDHAVQRGVDSRGACAQGAGHRGG